MKIVEEFGINPYLLIAQIVNFTILVVALRIFLYKPILKVLDERKKKVTESIKNAEEIEKRLEKISNEQTEILNNARSEASSIVAEAKKEAKELTERNLAETKANMEDLLKKNQERMALEKEQMLSEARKDLASLVLEAAGAVAKKTMTLKENEALVAQALKDLGENESK